MEDMGEFYRDLADHYKAKRAYNLATANDEGWTKHTEYHWSCTINGSRLDYWPSRNKWMYCKKVMTGNVNSYIAKLTQGKKE